MTKYQRKINKCLDLSKMVYEYPDERIESEKVLFEVENNILYIAIAGTDDLKDLFEDMDIEKKKIKVKNGHILVHSGFWESWTQIRQVVINKINDLRPREIQLTGHSKGGAMALCAYLDLPYFLPHCQKIMTPPLVFGCPRVLASSSMDIVSKIPSPNLFINEGDPVTKLPREYMGFETWGAAKVSKSPWWMRIYLARFMVHKLDTYIKRFKEV